MPDISTSEILAAMWDLKYAYIKISLTIFMLFPGWVEWNTEYEKISGKQPIKAIVLIQLLYLHSC